ncbi:MAG: methyltransferase domain-containing protein [Thermoleophilia bacterium]|nr:methyltransferase domain-containing protein [Thermoleophilia bacterium]
MSARKFDSRGWQELMAVASAIKLRLIEALAEEPSAAADLASRLGYDKRATEMLLLALEDLGHLRLEGGRFHLSREIADLVVNRESPVYAPNSILHQWNLIERWHTIPDVVRTGRQVPRPYTPERRQVFIRTMDDLTRDTAARVVELCLLRRADIVSVLDVGGGPGTYARVFSRHGIRVTIIDRPEVVEMIQPELEPHPGITLVPGDFNEDLPPGRFDLVFMGNIFHIYSPEENRRLLARTRDALNPGGLIAIVDLVRGRSTRAPLFALTMLVNTDSGGTWTEEQYQAWLEEAGFSGIEILDIEERDAQLILADAPGGWPDKE